MPRQLLFSLTRFRLRTLLILVAVVAAIVGWFVIRKRAAARQARAVAAIEELGGYVDYDFSCDGELMWPGDGMFGICAVPPPDPAALSGKSPRPPWLDAYLGVDFFSDVPKGAILRPAEYHETKQAFPKMVAGYTEEELAERMASDARHRKLFAQALAGAHQLKGLQKLTIWDGPITGLMIENLRLARHLDRLDIHGEMDRSALDAIAAIASLRDIGIWRHRIDDDGLATLCTNRQLVRIRIFSNSRITDRGLETLSGMKQLETLVLTSDDISQQGLEKLAVLPHLVDLRIDSTAFDIQCAKAIAEIKTLSIVQLTSMTMADDEMLMQLGTMANLRALCVSPRQLFLGRGGTGRTWPPLAMEISGQGMKGLVNASKLQQLFIGDCRLAVNDLRCLQKLPELKRLTVASDQFYPLEVNEKIRKMFPGVKW